MSRGCGECSGCGACGGRHEVRGSRGAGRGVGLRVRRWARSVRAARRDAGMVSAEYAVGILAAVGFAGLLYKVMTSGAVMSALEELVGKALHGSF
ncbi:DUF4244 domain-containing protein [Streptomyces xanthii]|uniref:DUF4244 domain-containing protein n=1 Tax=Streptomyces xanthii TaxID=2768069 RepID=A0A7H1B9X8_9ACTN|nr:DUF4244 domain-containing protein [Streptomyces xanthii]QNS05533.1 DUF4244 domain-containing protein [Streptomyces xanthii]